MTICREGGLRFHIFVDDHAPAHVHVDGGGCTAKIEIAGAAPRVIYARGMTAGDLRRALRIVTERQASFLECWRTLHG